MTARVRGPLRDTLAFLSHLKKRDRLFRRTPVKKLSPGAMNLLSQRLHPRRQVLKIDAVRQETPSSKTFRLVPEDKGGRVAFFRAGQYIAVEDTVAGTPVSRPFSISSSPAEALEDNFYEITVKAGEDGFFAPWALKEWEKGRVLYCSEPAGTFFYEPLRDPRHIVCLAGGSGITPFRSILRDALDAHPDIRFTLLYGVSDPADIMFRAELEALAKARPERFSMIIVCSGNDGAWEGESGFITEELIRKHFRDPERAGYFVCGPPAMYEALLDELAGLHLPVKALRKENYGRPPADTAAGGSYTLKVTSAGITRQVPADGSETVLTALERAGLNPPAVCRSGECGWCRSRLVAGDVFVPEENDGRRKADIKFGWFHPCSSYPRSDLVIEIPSNPVSRKV